MQRIVLVVALCSLLVGTVGCPNASGPRSGLWSTAGLNLPAGFPVDASVIDPDAGFMLINLGHGSLVLDQLADQIPVAVQGQWIANLEEILAMQGVMGGADLASLIAQLEEIRTLLSMGLGSFIPAALLQPMLDFFGVADLNALVNALVDMISESLLLHGLTGDPQQLLAELLALPGAFPDALTCSVTAGSFVCDTQVREVDLTSALDAVLVLTVDASGTFTGPNDVSAQIVVDASCSGLDCGDLLAFAGIDFPFTVDLTGHANGA